MSGFMQVVAGNIVIEVSCNEVEDEYLWAQDDRLQS